MGKEKEKEKMEEEGRKNRGKREFTCLTFFECQLIHFKFALAIFVCKSNFQRC